MTLADDFQVRGRILHGMRRLVGLCLLLAGCGASATLDSTSIEQRAVPRGISTECGTGGWCFVHPFPTGADLYASFSPSRDDVWFAGAGGTMLRFDGSRWSGESALRAEDWIGLDGTSASDVWAITRKGVFHYDGKQWSGGRLADVTSPRRIIARASDDAWLQHGDSGLLHHDGAGWGSVEGLPMFTTSLVATTRNELLAGRSDGVFRYSAGTWTRVGDLTRVSALGAASPTELWATTDEGLFRGDGKTWTSVAARTFPQALAVCGKDDVWIRGNPSPLEHWDGKTLTPVAAPFTPTQLRCTREGDLWITHQARVARYRAGVWWSPPGNDLLGPDVRVEAMWGPRFDDLFAVGGKALLHFDGKAWSLLRSFEGGAAAITGTADDDVWVGGATYDSAGTTGWVEHFDGKVWARTALSRSRGIVQLKAVARNDAWAVEAGPGETNVHRWNGVTWSLAHTFSGLSDASALVARGPNDLWLSTQGGLAHWDGRAWSTMTVPDDEGAPIALGPVAAGRDGALWFPTRSAVRPRVMTLEGSVFRTRYEPIAQPLASWPYLVSVFPGDGPNTWLSSTTGLHRHDGVRWSHVAHIDLRLRMWSAREGDVWAFGSGASGSPVLLRRLSD